MLVAGARNEEELALARQIGFSSAMIVPLVARGRTVGVVSFVATESGKRYDERDLVLAEEVGRRAGVALDNARLYREVQRSRDQLDIILQGVADGIIVYAADSRIVYANEAAAQMTGYASVQEMLATSALGIVSRYVLIDEQGQPFPHCQLTHRRVFAGEPEAQAIIGYVEAGTGGPERWSLVKSRPVLDESGEATMVITITHDITERMRVERRKDEFISMTSHELKTPVTSLKGFTHVLQRRLAEQGDEQGLHYLARMDAQLNKLTTLISDLLDISRIQSGKLALRTEPFDLDALIDETVENVQAATPTHQLLIEGRTGAQVFGDKERLGQVIINLLTNAIKYSPRAEKVLVRLFRDGNPEQAIVSVQDFGIGIDKTHHEKIFERFYQVTDPDERTYPGLGIGLYISSEIVARHHGRLWVESSKGEGATFFVALPLLKSDEPA
jgi:PAS domain S-box-containing protein